MNCHHPRCGHHCSRASELGFKLFGVFVVLGIAAVAHLHLGL